MKKLVYIFALLFLFFIFKIDAYASYTCLNTTTVGGVSYVSIKSSSNCATDDNLTKAVSRLNETYKFLAEQNYSVANNRFIYGQIKLKAFTDSLTNSVSAGKYNVAADINNYFNQMYSNYSNLGAWMNPTEQSNYITRSNSIIASLNEYYNGTTEQDNLVVATKNNFAEVDGANYDQSCTGVFSSPLLNKIDEIFQYIKVAVPILIILFGSIDLTKAVIASDSDKIKAATKSLGIRIMAGMAIYFIPTLINLVLSWVGLAGTCGIS